MTIQEIKEANRYYWIVKGQLIPECWSDKDVNAIYDSYFVRLWGNHEICYREEGFQEAWEERQSLGIEKIAVLGYN